jgi:PAS domain S-box-containing protein
MNYLHKELYEFIKSDHHIFDFIQDAALDGLWFRDVENPENEWMNQKFWTTLGYHPDEMPHHTESWQNLIHPDDLLLTMDNFRKHCENPRYPYDQVVRFTHKDGSIIWIRRRGMAIRDSAGKAIRMLGGHIDVTKEKENEEKLQNRNEILQSTMESYRDVLIFSIDRQYRYVVFNQAFKTATFNAYGTEVAKGLSMLESITNTEDRARAKHNCDRAFAGETHATSEVYGDLEKLYFETRYNPIINEKNEVTSITVMSANITDRKLAEEQLLALNKELESFSYSVSHDLRAPLRAINGYATILKEDFSADLSEEANKKIDAIIRNAKKMGNLIDDLLTFSHLGRKDIVREQVNMDTLVRQVIDEVNEQFLQASPKVDITPIPAAKGDRTLLKQVWHNLISNAFKYSRNNPAPEISIGCIPGSMENTYYVKDNGVGFDMAYYDKLFGVFQRLHSGEDFEGTGVGLAIVQRIVNRHGGKVWAESELGKGATFYFSLSARG